jgi:transcriptional antiterminator RfaH
MSLEPALHRWYVAQTHSFAEESSRRQLVLQGFEVFLPCYLKERRHARRVSRAPAPLFPRYIFIALDAARQRIRSVNGTIGVVRLISAGDRPIPIADGVVEELMLRRDATGLIPLARRQTLAFGDTVRIVHGAFAETLGLVEGVSDSNRVTILLDLLGRKVRVVIDDGHVEKAA